MEKVMEKKQPTAAESKQSAAKAQNAKRQREFWARQTPEERRARRLRYALNAAKRAGLVENECN